MPLPISDRRLANLYAKYEQQRQSNPSLKLGREQVLEILAEVGDRSGASAAKVLEQLKKPGLSPEAQVALVKKGMTDAEKRDLVTILDRGEIPLEPSAKDFLGAVLGRTPPAPPPGPAPLPVTGLEVVGTQAEGLSGRTKPQAAIEAINISAAPGGRLHMDDTMVVGHADIQGRFERAKLTGDQSLQEGDLVRIRARYPDGATSDWVTLKATGIEAHDTRNAVVALFRIGMTDKGGDKIEVTNINESRQVSEPGATLQLTNARTGQKTTVTITEAGGFPPGFTVAGKAGDSFSIAASDGVNNADYAAAAGNVTVPGGAPSGGDLIPDPALHKDQLNPDGTPRFTAKRFTGPLFVDGPAAEDVQQGQLGNCYFPAALAAIARVNPDAIQNLIRANGDGTYTVTFKTQDWATGRFRDVPIKVDGDLYVRPWGGPLYGRSANTADPQRMELWYPLVEKAYAQWKGSYNAIGNGGFSGAVFEAVLGRPGNDMPLYDIDAAWDRMGDSIGAKTPLAAGTFGEDEAARYTNTGVYADHAYSVLGTAQDGAQRYVQLRNPWGESEPAGNAPNDGIFRLKLEEFAQLFQNLMYVE